jgi:G:T/U-mismatch repair DNA glycosylase
MLGGEQMHGVRVRSDGMVLLHSQCRRKGGTNSDANLEVIQYNLEAITGILDNYPIESIFFTSRFVEKRFKQVFKDIIQRHPHFERITLPSPSRRYARMTWEDKVSRYKELLPKF